MCKTKVYTRFREKGGKNVFKMVILKTGGAKTYVKYEASGDDV